MGLMAELGVTGEVDAGEVEGRAASGGLAPEGIHHAVLNAAGSKFLDNVKRGYELTFRIVAGAGLGQEVKEIVWLPKGDDEKKDQKAKDRMMMFGWKLGLFTKTQKGGKTVFTEVDGKSDFSDCLGAQCFIEVQHEERDYEKDGKKKHIKEARLSYYPGLFHIADSQCAKIKKGIAAEIAAACSGAVVGAGSGGGAAGGAGAKDQFSDL